MKILEYSWILRIRARCRESQDPPAFVDGFGVKTRNSTENSALYVSCQAKVVMCCSSCSGGQTVHLARWLVCCMVQSMLWGQVAGQH